MDGKLARPVASVVEKVEEDSRPPRVHRQT
jgi:hypothetical protein